MKFKKLALLGVLLLAGCGPIIGQFMKLDEGVKEFEVTQGAISDLKPGTRLLVLGPFERTREGWYICKGEDADALSTGLQEAGLFQSEVFIEHDFQHLSRTEKALRGKSSAQLHEELGLDILPEKILFGTILHRSTTVAPARGVVMTVGYRLEFYDVASGKSTVVEVSVRELAEKTISRIVRELSGRLGRPV